MSPTLRAARPNPPASGPRISAAGHGAPGQGSGRRSRQTPGSTDSWIWYSLAPDTTMPTSPSSPRAKPAAASSEPVKAPSA